MISGMQLCALMLFLESLADNNAVELEAIRRGMHEALEKDYKEHYRRIG